jgi:hypothetical protein
MNEDLDIIIKAFEEGFKAQTNFIKAIETKVAFNTLRIERLESKIELILKNEQ